jgi:MoxR-like ATPase
MSYPFDLIRNDAPPLEDREVLLRRPFVGFLDAPETGARRFDSGKELDLAINTAVAVGAPLLISGDPGTGKTQAAYYAAYKLGREPVIRFQVKSDSSARDLLYDFDSVRYFYEANVSRQENDPLPPRQTYLKKGPLWRALTEDSPRVLLIDEIDKAPRDFPNDLLLELEQMEFSIPEVPELGTIQAPERELRPIVVITSNQERRLPEAFLRRCVYHHIVFSGALLRKAVAKRRDELPGLDDGFLELALQRFLELHDVGLRKPPSTAEYLLWLRVLAVRAGGGPPERLDQDLSKLPYLSLLIKDREDRRRIGLEV